MADRRPLARALRRRPLSWLVPVGIALATLGALGVASEVSPAAPEWPDGVGGEQSTSSFIGATVCLGTDDPTTLFDTEPNGIIGADYQRATPLPTGETLWTFQDAVIRVPGGTRVLHNIGAVQGGGCFRFLLGGTPAAPEAWLFTASTVPHRRWYWALDATIGIDGLVYVFAAEMHERGEEYLTEVVPTGTFVAGVDPSTWEVVSLGRPANASAALYGWSITSDHEWTYLFAQCHRQFGYDPWIFVFAHDLACSPIVSLARVPRGYVFDSPEYWTGTGWSRDPLRAVGVFDTTDRRSNPVDVVFENNRFHAVTKIHDWWGQDIAVERADRPFGPWEEVDRWTAPAKCYAACNTYYASWAPSARPDEMFVGLSHNRWDGEPGPHYRPTFERYPIPRATARPADRCASDHCD